MKPQNGCTWCVYILFGVQRLSLDPYALITCKVSRGNLLFTLPRLVKICKNRDFSSKIPLQQNFLMVENAFVGAPHTPKNFFEPNKVQSCPKNFFGHINDVVWIIELLDPKIGYFGRKIADCRIFCTPEIRLGGAARTPKFFFVSEICRSVSKNIFGFLTQF